MSEFLSPVEKVLLDIKKETIQDLQSKSYLKSNQQDFLNFLLNVSDDYFKTGLCPCSQKQFDFTASKADITVFGGAAGSGKSQCGIGDLAQHIHHKNFTGVVFRRTTPQLKGAGGMWPRAIEMYSDIVGKFLKTKRYKRLHTQSQDMRITFPSQATVRFRHMEHVKDKENIQG